MDNGGMVEARAEAATGSRSWSVLKVARRAHDTHCRRTLALLVGSELDDGGVLDKVVLLRILVSAEARRTQSRRPLSGITIEHAGHT